MTDPLAALIVEIEVVEMERVVPRGTARVRWDIRREDGWMKATDMDGAVVTTRDKGPGTIWERAVVLRVAAGTAVRRVEERPASESAPLDPLSYLKKAARAPRYTYTTRLFRVARDGRLSPEPQPR